MILYVFLYLFVLLLFPQDAAIVGNYGVRINVVCPAFVDTTLLKTIEQEDNMGKYVKYKDEIKQRMDTFGVLK